MKVYKASYLRLLKGIGLSIFAVLAIYIIAYNFVSDEIAAIIAGLSLLVNLFLVFNDLKHKVVVDNGFVTFKVQGEDKTFEIGKCSFYAKIYNRQDQTIEVTDEDNNKYKVDCSGISYKDFMLLLEDLRVMGENSSITKLN